MTVINEDSWSERVLCKLLAHVPEETVGLALKDAFPWLSLLPAHAVAQFVTEFTQAARICAELDHCSVLAVKLHGWKATAMIHADPDLLRQLSGPLHDDLGYMTAPMEDDLEPDRRWSAVE